MTKQKEIRKWLFRLVVVPLSIIPVSLCIFLDYVLDGKTFREGLRKYYGN